MYGRISRRRIGVPLALALSFVPAACTPAQQLAMDSGIQSAQQAKDSEARLLKASLCAMSIGAYHRINSDLERRALDVLCGGIDGAIFSAGALNDVP